MQALLLVAITLAADGKPAVESTSAVLKLAEDVAIPAREAGVLGSVAVKEGQLVEAGDSLAQILDIDAKLTVDRARLETEIAFRKKNNEVDVQFARKSIEVAKAELARSLETNDKVPKTVSNTELDRQRLLVERGDLEIKQAQHALEIAGLTHQVKENEQRESEEKLARRTILSPLKGMVVEVHRRQGEWVQPGETVARVVRLDRLRAEGFLSARHARLDLVGSKAAVKVTFPGGKTQDFTGEIVFVSPEIDPLNAQVKVSVEVDNRELLLRPGLQAVILLEQR